MKTFRSFFFIAFITTFIITGTTNKASAQLFTGGDLSATFVNGVNIDLAPIIGYKFHTFSAGFSPFIKYGQGITHANEVSFGGRIFAEYDVFKGFIIHAEGQVLNSAYLNGNGVKLHHWTIGIPIGAGYERELTKGVWLKTMVLWDPLQNINFSLNSPNSNPQVRGGITYVF
jgi:hypothetical protein